MLERKYCKKLFSAPVLLCLVMLTAANGVIFTETVEKFEKRAFKIQFKKIDDVIQLVNSQLSQKGSILLKPGLDTFTVEDYAENLDKIEAILKEFDVPPKNIEVIIKLIKASKKGYSIYSVPIKTIYRNEVSKINPFKDTIRFIVYYIKELFS